MMMKLIVFSLAMVVLATATPSASPSAQPTAGPSGGPTSTTTPTEAPTGGPTLSPTEQPTTDPTASPSVASAAPVTITSYDKKARLLQVIIDGEGTVTKKLSKNIIYGEPPDPIGPNSISRKCLQWATQWEHVVLDRNNWDSDKINIHIENKLLPKLARDSCKCNVVVNGDIITELSFPLKLEI